jgi:hypothetical protein
MTAIDTVRREMWESYQAHLGEGCIDRRLLLRWYGMLDGPALVPVKDADEAGENALGASDGARADG